MSKIFILCALLCIATISSAQVENIIEFNLHNPVTLMNNNGLYTLWKTNTSVHLNSTNENFKACTIDIDPIKDFTLTRNQVKELHDGKFLLWAFRSYNNSQPGAVSLNYSALIIDPISCSYKAVHIPEENKLSKNWPLFYSRVVSFIDGFDFFYPSHGKCSPCRFSLQGESIPLEYQLEPEEEVFVPYGFDIHAVDENDLKKGYIYTLNFKNDTSLIKHLDANFKVIKQAILNHPIHSLSVIYNKQPIISICYASHNFVDNARHNFKTHCEQLDSDLNSKFIVRLPIPEDEFVFGLTGFTHRVDPFGNMFIGLMQSTLRNGTTPPSRQLRFFAIDKSGKILANIRYEKYQMQSRNEWFELHSYLSVNKKFCIVTDVVADLANVLDTNEVITCLDVSKYSE